MTRYITKTVDGQHIQIGDVISVEFVDYKSESGSCTKYGLVVREKVIKRYYSPDDDIVPVVLWPNGDQLLVHEGDEAVMISKSCNTPNIMV
jgi:hypothetical protein